MDKKDRISVIIPCYNVQKYIMRCFGSIYDQTYGFENPCKENIRGMLFLLKCRKRESVEVHAIWGWISAVENISHL